MDREHRALGTHVLLDLWGVEPAVLDDLDGMQRALTDAARLGGATVVDSKFNRFEPHGMSGVVVLAESHLAVHTWPEHGFVAIDVFTCGDPAVGAAIADQVLELLKPGRSEVRKLTRGDP